MQKLRVLVTADPELPVPPAGYGGIERIINLLCAGLSAKGHEVLLLSNADSTCAYAERHAWRAASSTGRVGSLLNISRLAEVYRAIRPDIVHSFSRLAYLAAVLRNRVPKIMSYQREPTASTVGLAVRLARRDSLSFTGCSRYICERGKVGGGSWTPIHNFVDTEFYRKAPSGDANGPLVFLSRVESIKGADVAIDIARRTGRGLLIAGNHADSGPEGDFWETRIRPHLGKDGIEYCGEVNDEQKRDLLGRAAALLVPIRWNEPFGIVFAEALACGTPVISSARGALPEIVRHGVDGFLIDSVEDGCGAVDRLAKIDRNACRQRAAENFSIPVIVDRYLGMYEARCQGA